MKLTPLDIHHKEFRHSIRGYAEDEVDQFLNQVAEEFERLFKENIDLAEKVEALQEKVNEYELQRQTINNTLMAAQRSADDISARAKIEADDIVARANVRAQDLLNDALAKKQAVQSELARIKAAEKEFRAEFRALLEANLASIAEIAIDEGDAVAEAASEPKAAVAAVGAPSVGSTAEMPAVEDVAEETELDEPTPAEDVAEESPAEVEPTASDDDSADKGMTASSVSAVTLGEIEAPEVPDDVELVEPSEFQLPNLDLFGEREDDDIEEID